MGPQKWMKSEVGHEQKKIEKLYPWVFDGHLESKSKSKS